MRRQFLPSPSPFSLLLPLFAPLLLAVSQAVPKAAANSAVELPAGGLTQLSLPEGCMVVAAEGSLRLDYLAFDPTWLGEAPHRSSLLLADGEAYAMPWAGWVEIAATAGAARCVLLQPARRGPLAGVAAVGLALAAATRAGGLAAAAAFKETLRREPVAWRQRRVEGAR